MFAEAKETTRSFGVKAGRVGVTRLFLTDFRNYHEARLSFSTEPVVLTGPNGAGKTNLLEALSFLSPGRGLRGARLSDIDRRIGPGCELAGSGWTVAAVVETAGGVVRVGTGRDPRIGERRLVRIDGEPV